MNALSRRRPPSRLVWVMFAIMAFGAAHAASDPSIVVTDKGSVQGLVESGYRAFLGIPFAQPPVGNLRFAAPQPAVAWSGTFEATHFPAECAQLATPDVTTEDCLYLNVYTPPVGTTNAPVMVYIHGGGFTGGSAETVDPHVLAAQYGVVVVAIQYRLGVFGFMADTAFAGESSANEGNYGLLDQQAALAWAQRNAAAFGGNPARITVFGESAGGYSVCANLASPASAGLYQGALIESGLCTSPTFTQSQAETMGTGIASTAGCTDAATMATCLRGLPVETLLQAQNSYMATVPAFTLAFTPVAGGALLPLPISQAFATGAYNQVPIVQGSNHDEYSIFVAPAGVLPAIDYPLILESLFPTYSKAVGLQYSRRSYGSTDAAYSAVGTDREFACAALWADQSIAATSSQPLWAYEFSDPNTPYPFTYSIPLGAYHTGELQYVFDTPLTPFTSDQQALSAQMMKYWTNFAATGNPNGSGATTWPQYTGASPPMLSFIPAAVVPETTFGQFHDCSFWAKHVSG